MDDCRHCRPRCPCSPHCVHVCRHGASLQEVSIHVCACVYVACRHAGMQACRHAGMQACRHAGMQACRHAGMQACRHAGMHVCMHVCRRAGGQAGRRAGGQAHMNSNSLFN